MTRAAQVARLLVLGHESWGLESATDLGNVRVCLITLFLDAEVISRDQGHLSGTDLALT